MAKVTDFKDIIEDENFKTRGYTMTIGTRHMTNSEIIELINTIKIYESRYNIKINPRQHMIYPNEYLLSIDLKDGAQATFIKLFLTANTKYKIYKRIKTWKELSERKITFLKINSKDQLDVYKKYFTTPN